jgi:non-specific serine/threonine protein kinase
MNRISNDARSLNAPRIAIPTVLTSFVGRERELAEVARVLASSRLVTLSGSAGCGKTRLALRISAEVGDRYANGVHWIALARLADSRHVANVVARAVKVVEQPDHPLLETLMHALHDQHLLLVLDNCEHVLAACAQLAETLLAATDVSILATSREPLSVTGEMLYPVSPLSLPPSTVATADPGRFDAVQLFVERARALLPEFALTPENAAAIASICRHLDGLPLAIELASARVNVLTLEQIVERLDERFELLPPAPHVAYGHHRTLRSAIDWSYDLLSAPEQILLRRLSVFPGGCSLTTVEAVCAGNGLEDKQILGLLSSLVNKSLVVAATLQRGEARYSLLETIRQYAREKLIASGEGPVIHDRQLQWVLQVTEETAPKLSGTYQQLWLGWLEYEYDNIRGALTWSLESDRIEAGLRIAIALYQFWTIRDYVPEGLTWLERLLAEADQAVSLLVRANALAYASFLAGFRGNISAQQRYGDEAAALAQTAGDEGKPALAWALAGQGYAARAVGDYQTEFTLAKREIQIYRELGNSYLLGVSLSTTSFTAMSLGEYDAARAMLDEGLLLLREIGDPYRIAMALNFSGDLARCEQRYTQARAAYEESIALLRDLNAVRDLASALHNLGHTCVHLGDFERAHTLFSESLALH